MEKIIKNLVEQVDQLKNENSIYKNLFFNSPIAIWEEDITELLEYFSELNNKTNAEIERYFTQNADEKTKCFNKIKVVNANNALAKILRAKSPEYLISNRQKVYTKKTFEEFLKMIIFILNGGTSFKGETEAKAFDGRIIKFEIAFEVYKRTENGEVRNFRLISLTDITERIKNQKKLIEIENNLRHILDNSSDLLFLLDSDGKILDVNDTKLRLIKAERKDVIGNSLFDYMDSNMLAKSLQRFEQVRNDKTELNVIDEINNEYWESKLCPVVEKDKILKFVLYTRNVTNYVNTFNENKKLRTELDEIINRKQFEEQSKCQKLSDNLINKISQDLVAVKIKLHLISQNSKDKQINHTNEINEQIKEIDNIILKINKMAYEIFPLSSI